MRARLDSDRWAGANAPVRGWNGAVAIFICARFWFFIAQFLCADCGEPFIKVRPKTKTAKARLLNGTLWLFVLISPAGTGKLDWIERKSRNATLRGYQLRTVTRPSDSPLLTARWRPRRKFHKVDEIGVGWFQKRGNRRARIRRTRLTQPVYHTKLRMSIYFFIGKHESGRCSRAKFHNVDSFRYSPDSPCPGDDSARYAASARGRRTRTMRSNRQASSSPSPETSFNAEG